MGSIATRNARDSAPSTISGVTVEQVPFDAPWSWLSAGWRDMWAVPHVSLAYGVVFAALSIGLTLGLLLTGLPSLVLALAGGFLLIGPIAAVGLYEASRRLEAGRVELGEVVRAGLRAPGQLGFFGAILAFLFCVWLQLAFLLFMLFLGSRGLPPPSESCRPCFSPRMAWACWWPARPWAACLPPRPSLSPSSRCRCCSRGAPTR